MTLQDKIKERNTLRRKVNEVRKLKLNDYVTAVDGNHLNDIKAIRRLELEITKIEDLQNKLNASK